MWCDLVKQSANVNSKFESGRTVLILAAGNGRLDGVEGRRPELVHSSQSRRDFSHHACSMRFLDHTCAREHGARLEGERGRSQMVDFQCVSVSLTSSVPLASMCLFAILQLQFLPPPCLRATRLLKKITESACPFPLSQSVKLLSCARLPLCHLSHLRR
jgi:hypothetical protein